MKSILIKMSKFHPLLTDTLPYEVPILFSNRGLYETLRNAYDSYYTNTAKRISQGIEYREYKTIEDFIKNNFFTDPALFQLKKKIEALFDNELLPYEYMIVKNKNSRRKISLIHPISQIKICDLYAQHMEDILFYTNCNNISLRHPTKIVSRTFKQHTALLNKLTRDEQINCDDPKEIIENKGCFDLEDIPNNFFVYKKYRHIYAFYASKEFLELEQRFELCFKFDIKRCFDSIYTHSISWAIKGKEYAKKNKYSKEAFENKIDKLMQKSNWGETNGIPIGSEFSRIFAEIILQKIDQEVETRLESDNYRINGNNIRNGIDFKIRRYVDDFFVFVNSEDLGKAILLEYEHVLLNYKLFLNEKKYEVLARPFITNITAAKQKISQELKMVLQQFHNMDGQNLTSENMFGNIGNCSYVTIKRFIDDIRIIIHSNKIEMIDISNLILSQIKTELAKILKILLSLTEISDVRMKQLTKCVKKYLSCILELSFYIFHLSARANTTYGICKICFEVLEILKKFNDANLEKEIKQHIYSQFLLFFENKKATEPLIEFLDIIWVIKELGESFELPQKRLLDMIIIEKNSLSYFEIMTLLSYIKNNKKYDKIYSIILKCIRKKFKTSSNIFQNTETFMMFFDIIKCPYIEYDYKKEILNYASISKERSKIIQFIEERKWFYGWDEKLTLKKLFEIKELQNGY